MSARMEGGVARACGAARGARRSEGCAASKRSHAPLGADSANSAAAGFVDLGYARADVARAERQGVGEVIYGEGKTPEQIVGIARALIKINPEDKAALRAAGLVTRDPRVVERKKPGRPKARKKFQFSKR